MSDYYGWATLESWLAHECFEIDSVPEDVVSLFEKWRESIENNIQSWMDSDKGYGRASWRDWGFGFDAISDSDKAEFDIAIETGKRLLTSLPKNGIIDT